MGMKRSKGHRNRKSRKNRVFGESVDTARSAELGCVDGAACGIFFDHVGLMGLESLAFESQMTKVRIGHMRSGQKRGVLGVLCEKADHNLNWDERNARWAELGVENRSFGSLLAGI